MTPTGFGLLQNVTLVMMYERGSCGSYDAVSAIWNGAYDAGMAAGAAGIGLLVAHTGYPAFLLTAAGVLPALIPALGERARGRARAA